MAESRQHSRLGEVYVLDRGTVLYTGNSHPPDQGPYAFLTPHRASAESYASLVPKGEVYRIVTSRPLLLVPKENVGWALSKGKTAKGEEWALFGADEGDLPMATAFKRRRRQEASWLHGVDGWIYSYASPTLSEVLLFPEDGGV